MRNNRDKLVKIFLISQQKHAVTRSLMRDRNIRFLKTQAKLSVNYNPYFPLSGALEILFTSEVKFQEMKSYHCPPQLEFPAYRALKTF